MMIKNIKKYLSLLLALVLLGTAGTLGQRALSESAAEEEDIIYDENGNPIE